MNRVIKFRAKLNDKWVIGSSTPQLGEMPLSEFFWGTECGILNRKTLNEYVEFTNDDGSKGCGFEGDIIEKGGDNHNSVITFGENSSASVGFYTKESKLKGEHYNRYHGLPPDAKTVKIIGNVTDDKKLKSRWVRS